MQIEVQAGIKVLLSLSPREGIGLLPFIPPKRRQERQKYQVNLVNPV